MAMRSKIVTFVGCGVQPRRRAGRFGRRHAHQSTDGAGRDILTIGTGFYVAAERRPLTCADIRM